MDGRTADPTLQDPSGQDRRSNKDICEQIQSQEDTIPFLFENDQIALNNVFFRETINIIPMSLLAPFILQNCKTILAADPEL